MKTEFVDVNETRKNVRVEIPQDVVAAQIDRVARDYSRRAKIPGFRPGKAPARVIKQRFKDQILHDVAHDLIPRAVDDALRERGVEAVDTPDVRDGSGKPDSHHDVPIELGAKANPPGFDEQLLGLTAGATKSFTVHFPEDYPIGELANSDMSYTVAVKGLKRRVLPELDDEFAKD